MRSDASPALIDERTYAADELVRAHPPILRHPNKEIVDAIACPPGSRHGGVIRYSRWRAMPLPETIDMSRALEGVGDRPGYYTYEPETLWPDAVEWHVNFADPSLFGYYGTGLFAQDEVQCAEHPALGSLREALLAEGLAAVTVEDDEPTPVLVAGVERRCHVDTDPRRPPRESAEVARSRTTPPIPLHDAPASTAGAGESTAPTESGRASQQSPMPGDALRMQWTGRGTGGLYGNAFAVADAATIRAATTAIDPPTISNIVAMAAPSGGWGRYTAEEIREILTTATTAFAAAARVSGEAGAVIHTGFWGCGAFGGNRILMTVLQILAARMAGVAGLVMHTGDESGAAAFAEVLRFMREEVQSGNDVRVWEVMDAIDAYGFEWGAGDGS